MKICITGASGFVGKSLCDYLSKREYKVIASVRNLPEKACATNDDISFVQSAELAKHMDGCDVVVHLAGRAHVMKDSVECPYKAYHDVNVKQSIALAHLVIAAKVKRFVYLSSVKVMGEYSLDKPLSEADACHPEDDYGRTKLEAEQVLKSMFASTVTELVIVRPPLIYGVGVKANFKNLILLCCYPIPLPFGAINNKRSFVYLENLLDFIVLCCQHPLAAKQTFFVSDDDDISTTQLIRYIRQALKKPSLLVPIPQWALVWILNKLDKKKFSERLCGDFQLNIDKAKSLLSWQPPFSVEYGIKQTVNSFKSNL